MNNIKNTEVKKSSAYLNNAPLAQEAFASVRKPDSFVFAVNKAFKDLVATRASDAKGVPIDQADQIARPVLKAPVNNVKPEFTGNAGVTFLIGQLVNLLGSDNINTMASRLEIFKAMRESQQKMVDKIANDFSVLEKQAEATLSKYRDALSALGQAQSEEVAAKKELQQAQEVLAGMTEMDDGYGDATARVSNATKALESAQEKTTLAKVNATSLDAKAKAVAKQMDALITEFQALPGAKGTEVLAQAQTRNISNLATLTMLMAMFSQMLADNSEQALKNDQALFQAMQEGRQKEMDAQAAEHAEEIRKAEQLNKIMGCVGKILGALLTVVSVVSAAFTGGASLALAAVGVALMVMDEVIKATTGVSFMEEALKPLMENILQPIMKALSDLITKALVSAGVNEKTAQMVGAIAGAVLAAIATVAVVVAIAVLGGKAAASKLAQQIVGKIMQALSAAIKKLLPKLVSGLSKLSSQVVKILNQVAQRLGKALGGRNMTDEVAKKLVANTINRVVVGGNVVKAAAKAGGDIGVSVHMEKADEAVALFKSAKHSLDQMTQYVKAKLETHVSFQKLALEIANSMSDVTQQNYEAARLVNVNTRK